MKPPHHDPERIKPLIPILRKQVNQFLTDLEELLAEDLHGMDDEVRSEFISKEASAVFMPLVIFSINYTSKIEEACAKLAEKN